MKRRALHLSMVLIGLSLSSGAHAGLFSNFQNNAITSVGVIIGDSAGPTLNTDSDNSLGRLSSGVVGNDQLYAQMDWGNNSDSSLFVSSSRFASASGAPTASSGFRQTATSLTYTFSLTESHAFNLAFDATLSSTRVNVSPLYNLDRIAIEYSDGSVIYQEIAGGSSVPYHNVPLILGPGDYKLNFTSSTVYNVPTSSYSIDDTSVLSLILTDLGAVPAPEPASISILASAALLLLRRRK